MFLAWSGTIFTLIFHEGAGRGVYMATSAFSPGNTGRPAKQLAQANNGNRVGTLVYVRK